MTLDKATAAKLREMNLPLIEEYAKSRRVSHLAALEGPLDPIATATVRGQLTEARHWSRLSDAIEFALKQPEK